MKHVPFFLEEIDKEQAKSFLIKEGTPKNIAEILTENDERKNDAILKCSSIIFAVATNEGALIEIGKCCNTTNERKLRILVPKDRYHELSQANQTFEELNRLHNNIFTFENIDELKNHVEMIINKEIYRYLRVNNQYLRKPDTTLK